MAHSGIRDSRLQESGHKIQSKKYKVENKKKLRSQKSKIDCLLNLSSLILAFSLPLIRLNFFSIL
jgi:hypothetical protein